MLQDYKNYGKCVRFEQNGVIALITVDVGPRIIYYGTGKFNFLNEDLDRNVTKNDGYLDENYKKGETWYLYGGHRIWKSPEDIDSYTPDNYPVEYTLSGNGGVFTARVGKNFDYTIDVDMDADGALTVKSRIKNKSADTRTQAAWALTVAAKGGVLVVPLNDPTDELNPYQNLVQWPYNDLADERISFGKEQLILRQTSKPEAVKLGLFIKKRRAYYVLNDKVLKFEFVEDEGIYGDFWCNFETYTNEHILEVEGLTPLKKLAPGDSAEIVEKWSVLDFDGKNYDNLK